MFVEWNKIKEADSPKRDIGQSLEIRYTAPV